MKAKIDPLDTTFTKKASVGYRCPIHSSKSSESSNERTIGYKVTEQKKKKQLSALTHTFHLIPPNCDKKKKLRTQNRVSGGMAAIDLREWK